MNIENPFESGHIRNYILFYASILVIVILFFIASSMFNEVKVVERKVFNTAIKTPKNVEIHKVEKEKNSSPFKLLDKAY